jgi:hypothetical protein
MRIKSEPVIACHPPLCICQVLPEVNYKWAKDILLEHKHKPHLKSRYRIPKNSKDFPEK